MRSFQNAQKQAFENSGNGSWELDIIAIAFGFLFVWLLLWISFGVLLFNYL